MQFLVLYSREKCLQQTLLCMQIVLVTCLRAFVYYFLLRHFVKVSEQIGTLYDSGRTTVAKKEQRISFFNQSNRSIDLNHLISANYNNSSHSFYAERNIQRSSELESKEAAKDETEKKYVEV